MEPSDITTAVRTFIPEQPLVACYLHVSTFLRSGIFFIAIILYGFFTPLFSDSNQQTDDLRDSSVVQTDSVKVSPDVIIATPEDSADTTSQLIQPDTLKPLRDTLETAMLRDSLSRLELKRRLEFYPTLPSHPHCPTIAASDLFRSDATTLSDIEQLKTRFIAPRTGIANYFNRQLYYGNTAPLTRTYNSTRYLYDSYSKQLNGNDVLFPLNYSEIAIDPDGTIHFIPHFSEIVVPEMVMSWETGVFDENILSVRFTRPLSKRLLVNIFSNYRSFKNVSYSHSSNDIDEFYRSLYRNDSLSAHKGYNPLVREYFCGLQALWNGATYESIINFSYGDVSDEIALDAGPQSDNITHARLNQFPLSVSGGIYSNYSTRFFFGVEGEYEANVERWSKLPSDDNTFSRRKRIESVQVKGSANAGISLLRIKDSLSISTPLTRLSMKESDTLENNGYIFRPQVQYSLPIGISHIKGIARICSGFAFDSDGDDYNSEFLFNGSISLAYDKYQLDGYFERDEIRYFSPADSIHNGIFSFHEPYTRTGIEVSRAWAKVSLLLGYQWCSPLDTVAINFPWISGRAPYMQPQSVFLIAPVFGRWKGISLSSRCMISDTRPYVKVNSVLSMYLFPNLAYEVFDIRIGFDYWSKRDPVVFAEQNKWYYSIFDLNIALSVQIKSFRMIYKIDNFLNRKFSYIPGYYSPGLTFRWGFSWFIQR